MSTISSLLLYLSLSSSLSLIPSLPTSLSLPKRILAAQRSRRGFRILWKRIRDELSRAPEQISGDFPPSEEWKVIGEIGEIKTIDFVFIP